MFDVTTNYIGNSRIPDHEKLTIGNSEPFYLLNSQITKKFTHFDVYLGIENLLDHTQDNPILDSENPHTSDVFDASLIYAPINGTMIYAGFRYKIN